jgi:hypothetical protein
MQTPGAENAMLKKRVADCTDDRRSVAGKCHFLRCRCESGEENADTAELICACICEKCERCAKFING